MSSRRLIPLESLTPAAFAPFGTVIQNPSTAVSSASSTISPIEANQGTATKYADICAMENYYHLASSRKPGRPQMSMFICKPRELRNPSEDSNQDLGILGLFDINILERHPFTTQTFIPIGLSCHDPSTCYLVIVAPTMQASPSRDKTLARPHPYPMPDSAAKSQKKSRQKDIYLRARPKPFDNDRDPPPIPKLARPISPWSTSHSSKNVEVDSSSRARRAKLPKGAGPPNLTGLRAFLARGNQAVTYGAGTWHAPMVVLGAEPIEFVVLQFSNGVNIEDCQETELENKSGSQAEQQGISVAIDKEGVEGGNGLAELRSKL